MLVSGDMILAVQGVLEVASNTITLLSTPNPSQFVAMRPMDHQGAKRRKQILDSVNGTNTRRLFLKYPESLKFLSLTNGNISTQSLLTDRNKTSTAPVSSKKTTSLSVASKNSTSLLAHFGPNSTEVELSRIELEKVISGELMKGSKLRSYVLLFINRI